MMNDDDDQSLSNDSFLSYCIKLCSKWHGEMEAKH